MKSFILFLSFALISCTGPLVKINEVDQDIVKSIVLHRNQIILKSDKVIIVGVVEATSCKHLLWEPDATEENCIDQLKMKTHQLGATSFVFGAADKTKADFTPRSGINRNCWNTIDCRGVAIIEKEQ